MLANFPVLPRALALGADQRDLEHAKKVMSDGLRAGGCCGLLVDSIHPLPDSQVKCFGEILRKLKLQISELLLVRFYFLIY